MDINKASLTKSHIRTTSVFLHLFCFILEQKEGLNVFVPFSFVIPCQAQLMPSMQLTTNHISPPGPLPMPSPVTNQTSQTGGSDGDAAYVTNYIPLFPGQVAPSDQAAVSSVSRPLSHDPLAQCLSGQDVATATPMDPSPLDSTSAMGETVAPSVITHTASSTVTPSDPATTFSHGTEYSSISTQPTPPPSQLQPLASLPTTSVQQPQTFAMPHPFRPSSANKNRPVQRIALANTLPSSHLILTGLLFLISRERD